MLMNLEGLCENRDIRVNMSSILMCNIRVNMPIVAHMR